MVAACPFPFRRGTPIRVQRMAEALARRGTDVRVVAYSLGGDERLTFPVHRARSLPTYRRLAPGPSYRKLLVDLLLAQKLREVIDAHSPELIHAHHFEGLAAALLANAGRRLPIVFDAHALLAAELPSYRLGLPMRLKRGIGRRLDRWLPRRADYLIAVSREIRDRLIHETGIDPRRSCVISNGVEPSFFPSAQRARVVSGPPVIVWSGNTARYQGLELLLHAFREVTLKHPEARLRILSEDSFADYEKLARDLRIRDGIELRRVGVSALPAELAEADVAVNPRLDCSGLPQKLLNYLASGTPVVSFDSGDCTLRHLETGWVVADRSASGLATGILRLLANAPLRERLGRHGRREAMRLTWDLCADHVAQVYEQVLASHKTLG